MLRPALMVAKPAFNANSGAHVIGAVFCTREDTDASGGEDVPK